MMTLETLRERLTEVDRELIALVADRQRIVSEIGVHKIQNAVPTRDYEREREVLKGARDHAASLSLDPGLAEAIMTELIKSSLIHQEQTRLAAQTGGAGKRVLIIGGAGKMGAWFAGFLSSQGFAVEISDPARVPDAFPNVPDWEVAELDYEIIVVATPIKVSGGVLERLAARKPRGLIVDLGSLKTPLRRGLSALVSAGCRVTSIHPMFGPETRLLSGRHVVFVDVGVPAATEEVRGWFASTMVEAIEMTLEDHDRLIAYVLGLSHALNLAFFTALASSGELVPRLQTLSSTTFDAQLGVARLVAGDNPNLYYEIQALNEYGGESLQALREAAERIQQLVVDRDHGGFVALMEAGKAYLQKPQASG